VRPFDRALGLVAAWDAPGTAVAILDRRDGVHRHGDTARVTRIASVTKLLSAWAVLVAVEEGSVSLEDPVGQPGCTLRHLLAHAGGYSFEGAQPFCEPATTRIYSNTGYDLAAAHVEAATGMTFADYLDEAVCAPLGMADTGLDGSAARDVWSSVEDLVRFAAELRAPTLVSRDTWTQARSPAWPALGGVVPGVGRFDPCPWGLGPELRGAKSPHWLGGRCAAGTAGHFGGTGSFLWHDPVANVAAVALCDREFGGWAMPAWPDFSDAVVEGARA
jgi:CubicO group peptidase (beta-lactamase class C family)